MRGYAEEIRIVRIFPVEWKQFLEAGTTAFSGMTEEEERIAKDILSGLPGWHRPRAIKPEAPFKCTFHAAYAYGIGERDCLFFEFTPKIAEVGDCILQAGEPRRILDITDDGFAIDTGETIPFDKVTKADIVQVGEV